MPICLDSYNTQVCICFTINHLYVVAFHIVAYRWFYMIHWERVFLITSLLTLHYPSAHCIPYNGEGVGPYCNEPVTFTTNSTSGKYARAYMYDVAKVMINYLRTCVIIM